LAKERINELDNKITFFDYMKEVNRWIN
jgi:hypothetical protein